MDISLLSNFIVFSRYMNFTEAAEAVHLTQSSLSKQIASLEKELGGPLVDRHGHGLSLTPAGRLLLNEASVIVSQYEDVMAKVRAVAARQRQTIIFSGRFRNPLLVDLVSKVVTEAARRYPDLFVRTVSDDSQDYLDQLFASRIDLLFAVSSLEHIRPELVLVPLFSEPLMVLVPKGHRIAKAAEVPARELQGERVICRSGLAYRDVLARFQELFKTLDDQGGGGGTSGITCRQQCRGHLYPRAA
jgi:DNA-binding transcriptional LysR family regulator